MANSNGMTLDQALKEAAERIDEWIEAGSKIAPLNFNSPHDKFSGYVLEGLTANLVESRKLIVVDRKEVALIRSEFAFQLSGEVDDDSIQDLGRMLGAQSIISGSLTDMGGFQRIVVRVRNVQNASVEVQYRANIVNDNIVAAILTGGKADKPAPAVPSTMPAAAVTPQATPTTSTAARTTAAPSTTAAPVVQAPAVSPASTYKAGDRRPAGGIIFFVNPAAAEDGWKYLEAAPSRTEVTSKWTTEQIPANEINGVCAIGMRKPNSEYIMRQAMQRGGGLGWAAQACDVLEVNGFDDWFLPSRDELNMMWGALHRSGLGTFKSESYWSSTATRNDGLNAITQNFSNGYVNTDAHEHWIADNHYEDTYRVRAIRQF